MVRRDRPRGPLWNDRSRRRAQMILVGAVTLAAVIIGLTVVVNSNFVNQTNPVSEVSSQIDEAREFEHESRKGSRSLVVRLNHRHRNLSGSELGAIVDRNLTVYSQLMSESYVSLRGEYVNLTYNNESSAFGSRVVQASDGKVTAAVDAPGNGTWTIGESSEARNLGWFTMNVNVEETSEVPMWINVSNTTGHWVNTSVNRTAGNDLRIASNVSHGGNATAVCDPSRDRVLLDFLDGSAFTGECQFNGTSSIAPPYTVDVSGGRNVVAKYELVYNESVSSTAYQPCTGNDVAPDHPCRTQVVWTANVTTAFAGSELTYTNDYNVSVYREAR